MEVKKKTYTPNSEATIKCQEKFGKNSYNGTTKSAGY